MFLALAVIVGIILAIVHWLLPEAHKPDRGISLRPLPILLEYIEIIRHARFATYALAGALAFAGLFTYVAGSPIIFMEGFHLSPHAYSAVFALLAGGFIGGSQVNVFLLNKFKSEQLVATFSREYDGHVFRDKAGTVYMTSLFYRPLRLL